MIKLLFTGNKKCYLTMSSLDNKVIVNSSNQSPEICPSDLPV